MQVDPRHFRSRIVTFISELNFIPSSITINIKHHSTITTAIAEID